METKLDSFEQLLQDSELLSAALLEKVRGRLKSASGQTANEAVIQKVLSNLVASKRLSQWQADVLAAGHSGPFQVGNYRLIKRITAGPVAGGFLATHLPTRHPVLLQFVSGTSQSDLLKWQAVQALADRVRQVRHPRLVPIYESVTIPEYRFIVSEAPVGTSLDKKLPLGMKLPWRRACEVVADVAAGLAELHRAGVIHHSLSPRTVWLHKSVGTRLRVQILSDNEYEPTDLDLPSSLECKFDYCAPETTATAGAVDERSDLYSLGCLLHRLLFGSPPFPAATPAKKTHLHQTQPLKLEEGKTPAPVTAILQSLLTKSQADRVNSASQISKQLMQILKLDRPKSIDIQPSPTVEAYADYMDRWRQADKSPHDESFHDFSEPNVPDRGEPDFEFLAAESEVSSTKTDLASSTLAPRPIDVSTDEVRPNKRWSHTVSSGVAIASLILTSGAAALLIYQARPEPPSNAEQVTEQISAPADGTPEVLSIAMETVEPFIHQVLLDDDQQTLWESPTTNGPIGFRWLPPSPATIVVVRVADLLADEEGKRIQKSLGPETNARIESWLVQWNLPRTQIKRLLVSFHLNDEFRYEPFFLIDLVSPVSLSTLPIKSVPLTGDANDDSPAIFPSNFENQFVLITRKAESTVPVTSSESTGTQIEQFAIGTPDQIRQAGDTRGMAILSGALGELAQLSDSDRFVTALTLRNSWFNDAGRALMGDTLSKLNRQLRLTINENITAAMFSLHLDRGSYFEFRFAHRSDIKTKDLNQSLQNTTGELSNGLVNYLAPLGIAEFWTPIRDNIGPMLDDFQANLRWGIESRKVVANCWLPHHAPHNLMATAELVTWQTRWPQASDLASETETTTTPQTLEELLLVRRTLDITNPPDLGVLLAAFEGEVQADFPALPFKFSIKISGTELRKEGITQNQRPAQLSIQNKTVAEILTSIMVSANPDKTISGPADPNCKLVWTVTTDPQSPDSKMVLVTTRAAALRDSTLRPEFQDQQ